MGFNLPRISITVDSTHENNPTSGKFSILSIGFGIHQAWIYTAMFGASSIFQSNALIALPAESPIHFVPATLVFLISIIVFGACLLFASFTDQKFLKFYVSKKVLIGSAILTSVGTMSIFLADTASSFGWFIVWFAGISTGIGSSMLLLSWGTAFSRHGGATIVINTATAIVIAIGLYSLILHGIPAPYSGIVTALLPILELIFLWRLTPMPYSKRHAIPIFNPLPVRRASFIFRFGIPVLIFGFALGALRAISMQVILPNADAASQIGIWLGAGGIAMILTLITVFTVGEKSNWDLLFRALIPFITIAILTLPFLRSGDSWAISVLLLVGFMCFEALMWIFFGELSQSFRISPIFVFGLGRGLLALGSAAGSLLALYTPTFFFMDTLGQAGEAIVLLLAMVIAYMLLPRQREIRSLVLKLAKHPVDNMAVNQLNVRLFNDEHSDDSEAKESDEIQTRGRFRRQCETIADRYLLSRRETEVMFLLAKGHNAAFIQDKLCISRSTAKTHISHIYRKLDIHTQQELLNMVDAARAEVTDRGQAAR